MVIYRSELSRSRTSIHGGLRRGAAAAAVGAVLVLSAGVPASRAADGSTDPTKPGHAATDADLSRATGLLKGLLNDSGDRAGTASPEPSPSTASTAAPTSTQSPATAPTTTAPASPAPTPVTATPATQGAVPQGALPTSTAATPLDTLPASGTDGAGTLPGKPAAPAGPQEPGEDAPRETAGENDGAAASLSTPYSSGAAPFAGLKPTGNASASQQNVASAAETEPVAETAKVLLGVGLLGSAGAAGLAFARIRRI